MPEPGRHWGVPHGEALPCSSPAGCHCISGSCWDLERHVYCTGATAVSPGSCWERRCHWQVLLCWELVFPDRTPHSPCSAWLGSVPFAHILLACGPSHPDSALLGVVVLPASCWELGCHWEPWHCVCPAGNQWIPCVLLGAGACYGAEPHWELGVSSSHHSLGSQGISWELVHATSPLSG